MNKGLSTLVLLALSAAVLYLFRTELISAVQVIQARDMFVREHGDTFTPGPALGSSFPGLTAYHGGKKVTLLQEFAGKRGTVLVLDHDPDLSPFARRNLAVLAEIVPELRDSGVVLVALLPAQASASDRGVRNAVPYPVLHDHGKGLSVKTLGVVGGIQAGATDPRLPYPGAIFVTPQGVVAGKVFLEDGTKRLAPRELLKRAQQTLVPPTAPGV